MPLRSRRQAPRLVNRFQPVLSLSSSSAAAWTANILSHLGCTTPRPAPRRTRLGTTLIAGPSGCSPEVLRNPGISLPRFRCSQPRPAEPGHETEIGLSIGDLLPAFCLCAAAMMTPSALAGPVAAGSPWRDLRWGTLPDEIEEKFGAMAERDEEACSDEAASSALAEQGEDCVLLKIDRLFVNGTPFSVTFRFDAGSQGLRMVTQISTLKSKSLDPRAVRRMLSECRQGYDRIAQRINLEFGPPLPAASLGGQPEPTFTKADYAAWAKGDTGVWLRRSYGYTDHWKRWRKADGCEIELRYFSMPAPITNTEN